MKKCKVKLTAIEYKGKIYKPGKIIQLDDKDAADLIKSDFVTEIKSQFQEDITEENERKKELEELNIPELKEIAVDMDIKLTVTKKAEIIEVILEAEDEL